MKRRLLVGLALAALAVAASGVFAAGPSRSAECKMGKICPLRGLRAGGSAPCGSPTAQFSLPMPCCERLPAAPVAPAPQPGAPASWEPVAVPVVLRDLPPAIDGAAFGSRCPYRARLAERGLEVAHAVFRI